MNENIAPSASSAATVTRGAGHTETIMPHGRYEVDCRRNGQLVWRDTIDNLITNVGSNLINDTILGNSAAGAVVMGLMGAGTPNVADTQASHAGWLEVGLANLPTYTGNRQTPSFSASSARSKATSAPCTFPITNTGNVAGCFINVGGSATKDNTSGTLLSVGAFANGTKPVSNGDTINVNYTFTS
ncbi:MAG TPA: hypothetical protein VHN11_21065 [Xanthobacteraceae bacterium]|jgi:hypothetical protein|nr:hypothetical protein [Xanthobacteraceae bacterium]